MKIRKIILAITPIFFSSCNGDSIVGSWKYQNTFGIVYETDNKITDYKELIRFNSEEDLCNRINEHFASYQNEELTEDESIHFSSIGQTGKKLNNGESVDVYCVNYHETDDGSDVKFYYSKKEDGYHIYNYTTGIFLYDATFLTLSNINVDRTFSFGFQCVAKNFVLSDSSTAVLSVEGLLEVNEETKVQFVVSMNYKKI